jgi:methylmalonyl-CoA mutase
VTHLYSVEDGQKMGLQGMINDMVQRCDVDLSKRAPQELKALEVADRAERLRNLSQIITALENGAWPEKAKEGAARQGRRTIGGRPQFPPWASPAPAAPASPR